MLVHEICRISCFLIGNIASAIVCGLERFSKSFANGRQENHKEKVRLPTGLSSVPMPTCPGGSHALVALCGNPSVQ